MADFEAMLPAQRPVTRALDLIKLFATVVAGIFAILLQFKNNGWTNTSASTNGTPGMPEDGGEIDAETETFMDKVHEVKATLIMLGTYAAKVAMGWKTSQTKYANLIRETVFTKFMDSGHGVRTFLMDAEYQQDFKEALMAYVFAWLCPILCIHVCFCFVFVVSSLFSLGGNNLYVATSNGGVRAILVHVFAAACCLWHCCRDICASFQCAEPVVRFRLACQRVALSAGKDLVRS